MLAVMKQFIWLLGFIMVQHLNSAFGYANIFYKTNSRYAML